MAQMTKSAQASPHRQESSPPRDHGPALPGLPTPDEPQAPKKTPNRGIRKRVLGEGDGDYCIYELIGQGSELPVGALIPIPAVPRFKDTTKAVTWIRNESGDLLAGKQVMVFQAKEIMNIALQQKPTIVIQAKPKITVSKPEKAEG